MLTRDWMLRVMARAGFLRRLVAEGGMSDEKVFPALVRPAR